MRKTLTTTAAALLAGAACAMECVIEGSVYPIALEDNDLARDLRARLPLTVHFEDYGQTERIAYLSNALTVGRTPTSMTPTRGTLAYYIPWGNLAVFLKDFSHSEGLAPLGRLDDSALQAIARSADKAVILRARAP